jgi:hypothetical protein
MALSLSKFYTERSAIPDTYERPREPQHTLPQPPPRERRDRPGWFITIKMESRFSSMFTAGDRERNHPSTSQGQRMSPPHHLKATEPPPPVQRSRVPLPSQAEAMRFGHVKKPRHIPMDVDVNENINTPDLEQAPTRPKVSRPRGKRYAILLWRFSSNAVALQDEGEAGPQMLVRTKRVILDRKAVYLYPPVATINPRR